VTRMGAACFRFGMSLFSCVTVTANIYTLYLAKRYHLRGQRVLWVLLIFGVILMWYWLYRGFSTLEKR